VILPSNKCCKFATIISGANALILLFVSGPSTGRWRFGALIEPVPAQVCATTQIYAQQ
jgi:hypothetical protein